MWRTCYRRHARVKWQGNRVISSDYFIVVLRLFIEWAYLPQFRTYVDFQHSLPLASVLLSEVVYLAIFSLFWLWNCRYQYLTLQNFAQSCMLVGYFGKKSCFIDFCRFHHLLPNRFAKRGFTENYQKLYSNW